MAFDAKYTFATNNDEARPLRTTGKFAKYPPIKTDTLLKKSQNSVSVHERLENARSDCNTPRITWSDYTYTNVESTLCNKTKSVDHLSDNSQLPFHKKKRQARIKYSKSKSSISVQERLDRARRDNSKVRNNSPSEVDQSMPNSRSTSCESLNQSPVNKIEDARLSWAMSRNFYSADHKVSSNDQLHLRDNCIKQPLQSIADICFRKALQDCEKYQKIEEERKTSPKPSIRPQKLSTQ